MLEIDTTLGFPKDIEVCNGEYNFIQPVDFWHEPFICHHCFQTDHIKTNCLTLGHCMGFDMSLLDTPCSMFLEDSNKGINSEKMMKSAELDTFMGNLKLLFPCFLESLSQVDISLLENLESWILDFFKGF